MVGRDPDHWLHRLTPDEWLRAADNELARANEALSHKQQRAGVATARRAAGMAWNAVLALADEPDAQYGRSYMDHLQALTHDQTVPKEVRTAAQALVEAPLQQTLVPLGAGDTRLADSARTIIAHARATVSPPASA